MRLSSKMRPTASTQRLLLCLFLLAGPTLLAIDVAAQPIQLVTAEEAAVDASHANRVAKSAPMIAAMGAPKIEVQSPRELKGLTSPFPIKVAFRPDNNAEISVDSFRILYGALKLDITDRVLKKTKVTKEGLDVPQASIPPGSHTLTMRIKDSAGREGELRLGISVAE